VIRLDAYRRLISSEPYRRCPGIGQNSDPAFSP
jgi:hypothetical protein